MKRKALSLVILISIFLAPAEAQNVMSFSLQEAQDYAIKNNYGMKNAMTDVKIAKKKVQETTTIGLPQISAEASYNNFIKLPTQLIPGEFFGQPAGTFIPVQFGTKHNMTASATLSQLLFSGSYIVGLQASKAYLELSKNQVKKTKTELKEEVAKAYFMVLVARENKTILDSTLKSMEQMRYEITETYKSGFVEDTDVDQIDLMVSNLVSSLENINKQLVIAYKFLKFQMGLDIMQLIELTDDLENLLTTLDPEILMKKPFDLHQNIDYLMVKNQQALAELDLKLKKAAYLPNLAGYLNFQENAQRQEFDFFSGKEEWFQTTVIGLQLDIPIFSSGNRKYQHQQSKLQLEKVEVLDQQVQQGLMLELENARTAFLNAFNTYSHKKESLRLADKIYKKTQLKYREGISGSMELQQAYTQFLQSESEYILSIQEVLNQKTALEKIHERH